MREHAQLEVGMFNVSTSQTVFIIVHGHDNDPFCGLVVSVSGC
jgi:hypothetical protein